jgi:acyl dehydratase
MKFTDFEVGQTIQAGPYRVEESAIIEFATRFDPQYFHLDKEAAQRSRWQGLIASGFHTCAIAMRLMADSVLRDSESCGSPGLEYVKWPAPVRGGDTLRLVAHVLEVRKSRSLAHGVVRCRWCLFNQRDQLVLDLIGVSLFSLTG